jgi:hypothetical protein
MSMRNTNMLVSDGLSLDQTGLACRADGYYGFADGMHTIGFYLRNFKGRLMVEASLSDDPAESDWFPIGLGHGSEYFSVDTASTKVETFNIVGNFVYLRAKIMRSHLNQTIDQLGTCERVTLSL